MKLQQRKLIKNTIIIALIAQLSRFLGIFRELLMLKVIGVGALSDAFLTAYKVPTTLRKIFAEGALSNTIIPHFALDSANKYSSGLATLLLGILQLVCLIIVSGGIIFALPIIANIAPGFSTEQLARAAHYLTLFMPFTFFLTAASLLGGVLQASHHFIIPASMPIVLNIFFIGGLWLAYVWHGPITWVCWGLVIGALVQFMVHISAYYYYGFRLCQWTEEAQTIVKKILKNFLIYLPAVSVSELNLFIDTSFASTLAAGTVSLLYYAGRFTGIPLSVIIGSFTTVLLPSLARFCPTKNRQRLALYLHHAIVLVLWITIPTTALMMVVSNKLFITLFVPENFTYEYALTAGMLLKIFSSSIIFLSINRIVANVFYACKNTTIPTIIALITLVCNCLGNYLLIRYWGAFGLASATSLSAVIQTILSLLLLYKYYRITLFWSKLLQFLVNYGVQLVIIGVPFSIAYLTICSIISAYVPCFMASFLLERMGYWLWAGPFCGLFYVALWWLRVYFNVRVFFIE